MDRIRTVVALLIALGALCGCSKPPRQIVVGAKSATEQSILAEIVAQQIEKNLPQYAVTRQFNMGGSLAVHQALVAGQADIYAESTGLALTVILGVPPVADPDVAHERARRDYAALQLVWMPSLGFTKTFQMAVRGEDARTGKLQTLSDAVRYKPGWAIGVTHEFQDRQDGYAILMRTYDLPVDGGPQPMEAAALFQAIEQKKVNMIVTGSTDGLPSAQDLKVLRDDKRAFVPEQVSLVVRAATLAECPGLDKVLGKLNGRISAATMQQLNAGVDAQHRPVAAVAQEFLSKL